MIRAFLAIAFFCSSIFASVPMNPATIVCLEAKGRVESRVSARGNQYYVCVWGQIVESEEYSECILDCMFGEICPDNCEKGDCRKVDILDESSNWVRRCVK